MCCAPPLLAILDGAGAGLAATIATLAFAGLAFGAVVLVASFVAEGVRRLSAASPACANAGPVDVTIDARLPDAPEESRAAR